MPSTSKTTSDDGLWLVILGPVDHINGRSEHAFPSREAANKFGRKMSKKQRRVAKIVDPDMNVKRRYNAEGERVDKNGFVITS